MNIQPMIPNPTVEMAEAVYNGISFRDFHKSNLCKHPFFWILTLKYEHSASFESGPEPIVRIAQWEPSNHKWYYPEPFEQRKECGYTDHVWLRESGSDNLIIVHMRKAMTVVC
jgi:hypothetical protein